MDEIVSDTTQTTQVRRVAQVLSMVKNMPFPFAIGVAMDTATYGAIKTNKRAADLLRKTSQLAIDSLQQVVVAVQRVAGDQQVLAEFHAGQNEQLKQNEAALQGELSTVKADLKSTSEALVGLYEGLPAPIQRTITPVEPSTITRATTAYIKVLRKRKWKWAAWSALGGVLLGIVGTAYLVLH